MDASPPTWADLKRLMITPQPDLVIQGVVSTDERELHFATSWFTDQAPPLAPIPLADDDGPAVLQVFIAGDRLRLEHPDGSPYFIVGDHAWLFEDDPACPFESDASRVQYVGSITALVTRPDRDRFEGTDFTTPTGPVRAAEYLGRPAWEVELAPPSHKPYPLTYVVDAETGLLLQERNERAGLLAGWTEFRVGGTIPDDVFRWDGPVVTEAEREAASWAEHEEDMRRRAEWFERHVAPQPLTVQFTVTDSVQVHQWEDDGSFEGSFSQPAVSFGRRPVTARRFEPVDDTSYEWTSGEWRWRIVMYDATLTPSALRSLQEQLRAIPD